MPIKIPLEYRPKILDIIGNYSFEKFKADFFAGLAVCVVTLPLSMAFSTASGLPPQHGLFTAIAAGIVASLLSGSRLTITAPTGGFVIVIAGVVSRFSGTNPDGTLNWQQGYNALVIATLMAGLMIIGFGLLKLGRFVQYIPMPVVTGFMTGIAVIIFSSQVLDFLGITFTGDARKPAEVIAIWQTVFTKFGEINLWTIMLGSLSLGMLILMRLYLPKLPAPIIVIIIVSFMQYFLFKNCNIATIGSMFGDIPNMLPSPSLPDITGYSWIELYGLLGAAFTIAMLASIESLLASIVADGMTGDKHRPNAELIGQGFANMSGVIFGGFPTAAAVARTATNIRAGAKTPIAGILQAVMLLLVMLAAAPIAREIPKAALAAVLFIVCYNMIDFKQYKRLFRSPKSDIAVSLVTFSVTILYDLNIGIIVGFVLASVLFMKRMSDAAKANKTAFDHDNISIYEISGPLFFGAVDHLQKIFESVDLRKVFILDMRNVSSVDMTGFQMLERFYLRCEASGTTLILSDVREQPFLAMNRCGFVVKLGSENICESVNIAVDRAKRICE